MSIPTLRRRATQKDIAKALGLSQAAVALALNPKSQGKLLPETVELVLAKAREMNYSPQRQASILRSGRSHTIGVVFVSGLYYAPQERVKHLARAATSAGYQLVAVDIDWFQRDFQKVAEYLRGAAAEGVILCNLYESFPGEWDVFRKEWPQFFLSCRQNAGGDQANSDLETAFYEITRHHLEQGSRNLTLLLPFYNPEEERKSIFVTSSISDRVQGFCRAIDEAGGTIAAPGFEQGFRLPNPSRKKKSGPNAVVIYTPKSEAFANVFELGIYYANRLLDKGNPLPDSLVCANDDIAFGVLGVCQQRGIRVPEDLLISGADDAPFGRYCGVPLTTIAQPSEQIARYGMERIVSVIENPALKEEPVTRFFPCRVLVRASTSR